MSSYTFTVKPGTTATIPVNVDLTGYTLKLVLDQGGGTAPVEVTSGLVAGNKQVTLDIPSGTSIFSRRRTAYRLVGTKAGTDSTLQNGTIYGESTLNDDNIEVTVVPNPAGELVKTVQEKYRDDFSGTVVDPNFWTVSTGPGMTVAVTASELRVDSGTTANSVTTLRSKKAWSGSYRVMFLSAANLLSQRIANYTAELRVVNAAGTSYAGWVLAGTTATTGIARAYNNGTTSGDQTQTSLPTTAAPLALEIENFIDEVYFHSRAPESTNSRATTNVKNRQTPDPNEDMFIEIRITNGATAPASSTRLSLDAVLIQDISELTTEITGGRGSGGASQAIPVTTVGSTVTVGNSSLATSNVLVSGSLSTTNLTAGSTYTQTGVDQGTNVAIYATRSRPTVAHLAGTTPGILRLEQSTDGTTYRETFRVTVPSDGQYHTFDAPLHYRYYRWTFTNGATAQTLFFIGNTVYRGEGPTDIDKILTFPLTTAVGQALALSTTLTGPSLDLGFNHNWTAVRAFAKSDQAGTLYIDESQDGTNWFTVGLGTAITAGSAARAEIPVNTRFARVRYVNGTTAATALFITATLVSK